MKSRYLWIGLAVVFALTLAVAPAFADDLPKIDVHITDGDSSEWYKNPIIIGGGALLFVLIVALASRGSGTTVVKS